jgi:hypothetical protein
MELDDTKPVLVALFQGLFPLGFVCATPQAEMCLGQDTIRAALARHARGDWGELDVEDWQSNEESLALGSQLISYYRAEGTETPFLIITDAERSVTAVLLPPEFCACDLAGSG